MAFDADEEILQDFLVEAGEILEQLQEQLVELEQNPDDAELLNAIFRGFHTVKGGAGFLQLDNLVDCCHKAENVFDILRNRQRRVTPELMDVVLQALDTVNEMFDQVKMREEPSPADPELIAALERLGVPEADDESAEAEEAARPRELLDPGGSQGALGEEGIAVARGDVIAILAAVAERQTDHARVPARDDDHRELEGGLAHLEAQVVAVLQAPGSGAIRRAGNQETRVMGSGSSRSQGLKAARPSPRPTSVKSSTWISPASSMGPTAGSLAGAGAAAGNESWAEAGRGMSRPPAATARASFSM